MIRLSEWTLLTFALAFVIALLSGKGIIYLLTKASFGQEIREEGPTWHEKKRGTPTMGAFIFAAGLIPAAAISIFMGGYYDFTSVMMLVSAFLFGVIGFSDDYIKVIKKRNLGLSAKAKFLAQALIATAVALFLFRENGGSLIIPFYKAVDISYFIIPFNVFILLATVNAVNLTDGIDGLAASTSMICMAFFAFFAVELTQNTIVIILAAAIGGVLGFFMFNAHPAKVFMGDTGSLFLGGIIGCCACYLGLQIFLALAGLVFFIETASVIIQVSYFKITHGKRVFLMTPIHHHFEKKGWSEVKIVRVASIITLVMGIISIIAYRR
ncbi:MAG: phospho-N-acetylmuramoyl-pentapeptide-transferase [Bacillota bacterium]|nr:phospho-N-acetylmuramoyl-pentapeptide-transferase [Bacillota bacterium]